MKQLTTPVACSNEERDVFKIMLRPEFKKVMTRHGSGGIDPESEVAARADTMVKQSVEMLTRETLRKIRQDAAPEPDPVATMATGGDADAGRKLFKALRHIAREPLNRRQFETGGY